MKRKILIIICSFLFAMSVGVLLFSTIGPGGTTHVCASALENGSEFPTCTDDYSPELHFWDIPIIVPFILTVISIIFFVKSVIRIKKEDIRPKKKKIIKSTVRLIIAVTVAVLFGVFSNYFYQKVADMYTVASKPIIYLYPEAETTASVKLGYPDLLTVSYPEYSSEWTVLAKPNGDLFDLETGKQLYSLYYESYNSLDFSVQDEGFVVKSEDVADFLDEKLTVLGLNYKEREEFIVYWLPVLKQNPYNYIRFATDEEIEKNMPLNISPAPDSVIRVLMTYKGLSKPIAVKEQQLSSPSREGFVAVEWGGTELNN